MTRTALAIMTLVLAWPVGSVAGAVRGSVGQDETYYPVAEVQVGQRGHGLTVVQGVEPARFEFEVLGLLADTFPGVDLIVARLNGIGLEQSGVAAGMSGSPVYLDGRLLGAVAYRMVDFGREAIAGIVPYENMRDLGAREQSRRVAGAEVADALQTASALVRGEEPPGQLATGLPPGLRRVGTPLILAGFNPRVVARLEPMFDRLGFVPSMGGVTGRAQTDFPALVAGGAVAVQLVRGDINVTATGTVTDVVGDLVYAFGHPFMQLGSVDYPMVAAEIITVLDSQAASQKLSAVGTEVIGAVRQDRTPGVLGVLGMVPRMVPVTVQMEGHEGTRTVRFEVVHDPLLTPLYLFFGLVNIMQSVEDVAGPETVDFNGQIRLTGDYDPIVLRGLYSRQGQAVVSIASWLSGIFGSVLDNDLHEVEVADVEISLRLEAAARTVRIERAWSPRTRVAPGEVFPVHVAVRPYRGATETHTFDVRVPEQATGTLRLHLAGAEATVTELGSAGALTGKVNDVSDLIQVINAAPRNDRLHLVVSRAAAGAIVGGLALPGLPPSVLEMLDADSGGAAARLSRQVLHRDALDLGRQISGSATLEIQVERQ